MSLMVEYLWLIMDGVWAALMSLNIVPMVVVAGLIGLFQSRAAHFAVKALICLGLAILIDALWPLTFGGDMVVPAITQLEVQIQMVMLYGLGYLILKAMVRVKGAISLTPRADSAKTD
ncbi:hypothetical protein Q1W73_05770 [Asticcacaulis sp. ZE23SCel15]|uniref:hypothetical protein n=1 Tax=Asticcacaulis sp. ZE23SCel15 TaxID=3059027 RepID=UPI00265F57EB|nr:hypothetical protein [Asticcacaulis sp. ZE23SCel15]WKL58493.1 hypothetical protein Q1W73_05770 [Asticcacaulis sp. ZE23SCel15]